jgi:hypothetical protein
MMSRQSQWAAIAGVVLALMLAAWLFRAADTQSTSQSVERPTPARSDHERRVREGAMPETQEGVSIRPEGGDDSDANALRSMGGSESPLQSGADAEASGARVAGEVRIQGVLAGRQLWLALVDSDRIDELGLMGVGVDIAFVYLDARKTTVASDGAFTFSGLPEDWSGALVFPSGYGARVGPNKKPKPYVAVPKPTESLSIDLERIPGVTGRFVSAADGLPMAGLTFSFFLKLNDDSEMGVAWADQEGQFLFATEEQNFERLRLVAENQNSGVFKPVTLSRSALQLDANGDLHVGDVYLEPAEALILRVVDREGRPVQNALAHGFDYDSLVAYPTDADGTSRLVLMTEKSEGMLVEASGYWARVVDFPSPDQGEVLVTLDEKNVLRIEVDARGREGLPPNFHLGLISHDPMDAVWDSRSEQWASARALGTLGMHSQWSGFWTGEEHRIYDSLDEEGVGIFNGLWPGRNFTVEVSAPDGRIVASQEFASLGRAEKKTHVFLIDVGSGVVEGVVLGPQKNAIEGASIWAFNYDRAEASLLERRALVASDFDDYVLATARTDATGRFRIEGIEEDEVSLWIESDGFAPEVVHSVSARPGSHPGTYGMRAGMNVTVRVVDASGIPIDDVFLEHDLGHFQHSGWGFADELGDGAYLVEDLPAREVEFAARLDGPDVVVSHDTRIPELTIVVPVVGQLDVEWNISTAGAESAEGGAGAYLQVLLDPAGGSEEAIKLVLFTFGESAGMKSFQHVTAGAYSFRAYREHPEQSGVPEGEVRMQQVAGPYGVTIERGEPARVKLNF